MTHSGTDVGVIIDVFADVVCPWCYIGERRLERAMSPRRAVRISRRWRPFQLQPDMPPDGQSWPEFVRTKFGGMERARPIFERVTAVGASVGVPFDFGRIASAPNTMDAHRLILLAAHHGDEWPLVARLFRAHFVDGRDVGDRETLVEIAREQGLDAAEAGQYLASDAGRAAVLQSQLTASDLGIAGVPFFVLGGRYGVSGAQPEDVLTRAIDRALEDGSSVGP